MCAEREQGIAIGLGPAHAGPLQEALDEVVGGRLDRPGAERETVEAEGRIVHALGVDAEVAALELQARGRLGGGRAARSAVRAGAGPCTSNSAGRRVAPAASVWQRIVATPNPSRVSSAASRNGVAALHGRPTRSGRRPGPARGVTQQLRRAAFR